MLREDPVSVRRFSDQDPQTESLSAALTWRVYHRAPRIGARRVALDSNLEVDD
jgi:hypothetical protein